MQFLRTQGPYRLTPEVVRERVAGLATGTYALGTDNGWKFTVLFVGRADDDLAACLAAHAAQRKYMHFEFSRLASAEAAFEQECALYHDFQPRDNPHHPERPDHASWTCPRCKGEDPLACRPEEEERRATQ